MTTIDIKAGERAKIISRFSSSIQATYRFSAETIPPGQGLSGIVEIRGSNWIFPKDATQQPLQAENAVEKGFWDSLYKVHVVPDCDVQITMDKTHHSQIWIYLALVSLVVSVATGIMIVANIQ